MYIYQNVFSYYFPTLPPPPPFSGLSRTLHAEPIQEHQHVLLLKTYSCYIMFLLKTTILIENIHLLDMFISDTRLRTRTHTDTHTHIGVHTSYFSLI